MKKRGIKKKSGKGKNIVFVPKSRKKEKKESRLVRDSVPQPDPSTLLQELVGAMKEGSCDPLMREMAKYAIGDVVGLGLMTQTEFDSDAEYDEDGNTVRESGRMRALSIIPTKIRASMLSDITPYFLARKGQSSSSGSGPKPKVTFYVPENGRQVNDNA